jgi:hypothetical protein
VGCGGSGVRVVLELGYVDIVDYIGEPHFWSGRVFNFSDELRTWRDLIFFNKMGFVVSD